MLNAYNLILVTYVKDITRIKLSFKTCRKYLFYSITCIQYLQVLLALFDIPAEIVFQTLIDTKENDVTFSNLLAQTHKDLRCQNNLVHAVLKVDIIFF